jgi:hypothetical protein
VTYCTRLVISILQKNNIYLTRLTRWMPLVEQELATFRNTWVQPRFLSGLMLLDLLYVCYVDRYLILLYFFFQPLCCLFFFDIRILITSLVSSNSSYSKVFMRWWQCLLSTRTVYLLANRNLYPLLKILFFPTFIIFVYLKPYVFKTEWQ